MPIFSLSQELIFPPVSYAEEDGLLAVGGDLSPQRLLLAYRSGIFPWFSQNSPILWWSPDPRFVLFPDRLRISKSMKQVLRQKRFLLTCDRAFVQVIDSCKKIPRKGQPGTWITKEMQAAYTELHHLGYAHSVEAWRENKLVGGLYGIALGGCFFGESMFATESNASKAAFIYLVQNLQERGYSFVDCQVYTSHLESLGAEMLPREVFIEKLEASLAYPTDQGPWDFGA